MSEIGRRDAATSLRAPRRASFSYAAAPDLVDREPFGVRELDAGRGQRSLEAAIPSLLPGALRFPDLTDAQVGLLAEHDVELESRRGSFGTILLQDLVDLVVLLARQRRRRVADQDCHDVNLTDRTVHAQSRRSATTANGTPAPAAGPARRRPPSLRLPRAARGLERLGELQATPTGRAETPRGLLDHDRGHLVGVCCRTVTSRPSVSVAAASDSTSASGSSTRWAPRAALARERKSSSAAAPASVRLTRTTRPSSAWRSRLTKPCCSRRWTSWVSVGWANRSSSARSVTRRGPLLSVFSRPNSVRDSSPPSRLVSSRVSSATRGSSWLETRSIWSKRSRCVTVSRAFILTTYIP